MNYADFVKGTDDPAARPLATETDVFETVSKDHYEKTTRQFVHQINAGIAKESTRPSLLNDGVPMTGMEVTKFVSPKVLSMVEGAFRQVTPAMRDSYMLFNAPKTEAPKEQSKSGLLRLFGGVSSCYGDGVQKKLPNPEREKLVAEVMLLQRQLTTAGELLDSVEQQVTVVQKQLSKKKWLLRGMPKEQEVVVSGNPSWCDGQPVQRRNNEWDVYAVDDKTDDHENDEVLVEIRAHIRERLNEVSETWQACLQENEKLQRELEILRRSDKQYQDQIQTLKADKSEFLQDRNQLRRDLQGMQEEMTTLNDERGVRDRELELLRKIREEQQKKLISSVGALLARDSGSLLKMTFQAWRVRGELGRKQKHLKTTALAFGQSSDSALRAMCFASWSARAKERLADRRQRRKDVQKKVAMQMAATEMLVPVLFTHWKKEVADPKTAESLSRMQAELNELRKKLVRRSGAPASREDVREQLMIRFAAEFFFEDQGLMIKCFLSWHQEVTKESRQRLQNALTKMEDRKTKIFGCIPRRTTVGTTKLGRTVSKTFFVESV
mmetsp:Transcript_78692/g.138810  ORF Transcript_78692/g.138810 Transcript_78692/m.138810 type:complete len:552 (+) Transcript_78692:30-1685(+)